MVIRCLIVLVLISFVSAESIQISVDKNQLDGEKITINNDKRHFVLSLTDRLSDRCKDQLCWLKQKFVKELRNLPEVIDKTGKPVASLYFNCAISFSCFRIRARAR